MSKIKDIIDYKIDWLITPSDLINQKLLVDEFFKLYENPVNFPDHNEREDAQYIKERIINKSNIPYTHLLTCSLVDSSEYKHFIGGCIVEFYPDSGCCFLAYLFVHPDWRGKIIGSENRKASEILLISKDGLFGLISFINDNYDKKVNAVLFASNNPARTAIDQDSIPPIKRLKFFKQMGAKYINFNYIMPPLDESKSMVNNLLLLCFPKMTNLSNSISIFFIMSFLLELTFSLNNNDKIRYSLNDYTKDKNTLEKWLKNEKYNNNYIGLEIDGVNILQIMFNDILLNRIDKNSLKISELTIS